MSEAITLFGGAVLGAAAALLLVPLTRRELATAVTRSKAAADGSLPTVVEQPPTRIARSDSLALAALSGVLLAYVLDRVGWSFNALPPLLLLVGLIQLAYCDLKRRLLPEDPRLRTELRCRGRRRRHRPLHRR